MIPVLFNHDPKNIIGKAELKDTSLMITFLDSMNMTDDHIYRIFGNIGFIIHESEFAGTLRILKKIEILEFSLSSSLRPEKAECTHKSQKEYHGFVCCQCGELMEDI